MISYYKALADETRLKIVGILNVGEFSVQEITRILQMGQSRISRHLKILSDAGIAKYRRDGARVFYRLNDGATGHCGVITRETVVWQESLPRWKTLKNAVEEVLEWRRSQSRSFFSEIGEDLATLQGRFFNQKIIIKELRSALAGTKKLADLGCGPGNVIRHLSKDISSFIGVDYSIKMLDHARGNLKDLTSAGIVDLRLGALEHLPLRDNEVDGLLVTLVLHHLAEPYSVFEEFRRVLQPGGTVTIVDLMKHEREEFRNDMADLWLGFEPEDLENWLTKAGFKDISVKPFPGGKDEIQLILAQGKNS